MSKNLKTIIIVGLIAIVATLSVAYAALSQTLNVTGTAEVTGNTWNIGMTVPSSACTATGSATAGSVAVNGTTATISGVKLVLPGDSVTCKVNVVNSGTVNAKLSAFTKKTASFTGSSTTAAADAALIQNNHTYTVTYDGSATPALNSALNTGITKQVAVTITFNSSATAVPTNAVTVGNLGATLEFVQA